MKVTSPNPEKSKLFLTTDGIRRTRFIEACRVSQDENIRPLTDKVTVLAPEEIDINLMIQQQEDQSKAGTIRTGTQAIAEYIQWQTYTIGKDINPSETHQASGRGAKRERVASPVFTAKPDTSFMVLADHATENEND